MSGDQKIVSKILDVINNNAPDSDVILFGSHARKDSHMYSDWDLLILLNEHVISPDSQNRFVDLFYEIELETGEIISPLIYSKKDWREKYSITPLYRNIEKDGVKLK